MNEFKNIIITKIDAPLIVHSEKGRKFQMTDRENVGLSLCIDGQITYKMNGKKFVSAKDTAVILPQGASYSLLGDKDGLFPVINFECLGLLCNEITIIPLKNPQACINLFDRIKKQYFGEENNFQIFSLFYKLLGEIFANDVANQSALMPAIEFIEQNISCPNLVNQDIADNLKISEVYLRKLFMRHLKTTPKQYILAHRLQEAKRLLTDTTLTVTAIAEKCGFSSVYHFSREFKRKNGITPTQYAQNNKILKI